MQQAYLHDIPLRDAWTRFSEALEAAGLWRPLSPEKLPLDQALERVTAEPVWAKLSSPHYHAAAMDGYAIRSEATEGASDREPVTLALGSAALRVETGDPMPAWADAVVPSEQVEPLAAKGAEGSAGAIRLRAPSAPWEHVRAMGEDMIATQLVLPAGHRLRPVDLGAIAGCGYREVLVRRKPRVAILPTGTELVPPGSQPRPGEIIEYNSLVLAAQVETWGGEPTRFQIIPDDLEQIRRGVLTAGLANDLVLVSAGSSAGSHDYTSQVIESLGQVLVHGIAVRPGHPVILGLIKAPHPVGKVQPPVSEAKLVPIIGVPGYPVSAALTGEIFVEPLLNRWLGQPDRPPSSLRATLTRKVQSSAGDDEYLRVIAARVGERIVAAPLSRGAGAISSLVRADGILLIPAGVQGHKAGEEVDVRLYRPQSEIERTIMILGSHDMSLDLMAQSLAQDGVRVVSSNVGSVGGLMALRRGEAHLAGCHLLDPATGKFNVPYVKDYLPGHPVIIVALVRRDQGLIVPYGNPRQLSGLEDLAKPAVTFVNRQRGSGTRLLLDYHLDRLQLARASIQGYNREEYTHLAVAAAVASGRADCGLGIYAAAEALELGFVPLFQERYDLVIPKEHYENRLVSRLLSLLEEEAFRSEVQSMRGYDVEPMGRLVARLE